MEPVLTLYLDAEMVIGQRPLDLDMRGSGRDIQLHRSAVEAAHEPSTTDTHPLVVCALVDPVGDRNMDRCARCFTRVQRRGR